MTSEAPFSVLLVEDDDVAAEAVMRGLRRNGVSCPITCAEDGVSALQILRGTHSERRIAKPYLVLLDLNLPGMNGVEFLQELRADAALRETLVFVLTTSGADRDRANAYQQNVAGYMVKASLGPQFSILARFLTEYGLAIKFP
jgi:CheY-like chemotaxis protein